MVEGYQPTPKEYLGKWLEPESRVPVGPSIPIFPDGFEGVYVEDAGVVEHSDSDTTLRIAYDHIGQEGQDRFLHINDQVNQRRPKRKQQFREFFSSPVFALSDFEMSKTEDPEREISLSTILPEDQLVLVNPKKSINLHPNGGDSTLVNGRIMLVEGNLTNLESVLGLLHEAGHLACQGNELSKIRERYELNLPLNAEEASVILREERDAWAYALLKIRPFVTKENIGLVSQAIHQCALTSYSNILRKETYPDWVVGTLKFVERVIGLGRN